LSASVVPAHGRGKLARSGRKKGARALVSRTFSEFAEAELSDPEVQRRIRERLFAELAGKKRNPLPTLAVLAAASVREKPVAHGNVSVVFVAEIVGGRGTVRRVELGAEDERPALPAAEEPAADV
jgi:hypothetical protein